MLALLHKIVRGIRYPGHAWKILWEVVLRLRVRWLTPGEWDQAEKLVTRQYRSYGQYIKHQRSKLRLRREKARVWDEQAYTAVLERAEGNWTGRRVVCLGARLGGEVRAFRQMGAFAVGIDLNPGYRNPYVLYGDFHKLAFPDASVDVVFTNSLDHALDTAQVAAEAHRVLRDAGILMVDAMDFGERETSYWESAAWSDVNDLIAVLTSGGFTVISREAIMNPWRGTSLWLKKILE